MNRLPLAALIQASKMSRRAFRDRVGATTSTLRSAETRGVSLGTADLWCERLGLHPVEVYGVERWVRAVIGGE